MAGEYFVAAELSVRGYLASITLRNSRGIDILASKSDASHSVSIQVKASSGKDPKWLLTQKSETFSADNHFYVFVLLREPGVRPDYYVVPSKVVADHISQSHKKWLTGTRPDGRARKDSSMRNFRDPGDEYREAWSLLGL